MLLPAGSRFPSSMWGFVTGPQVSHSTSTTPHSPTAIRGHAGRSIYLPA